ncbi:MAG TPA: hypothetical protein PKV33_00445 [Methanothrix sp.]|nr:hypothetical protein [Methanothrix sp.]
MLNLSASEQLDIWEAGLARSPAEWALLLLARAYPDMEIESLAGLCIGRRDALLISLREQLFGSNLACVTSCKSCGEELELDLHSRDILVRDDVDLSGPFSLSTDGFEIEFRLPNSFDLLALEGENDISSARSILMERCVLSACKDGQMTGMQDLPTSVGNALSERMSRIDSQADIRLEMNCPSCGKSWQEIFDIVSFLWREISSSVQHIFRDVATLAKFFGWKEKDILAMSEYRRQIYLEMVDQ